MNYSVADQEWPGGVVDGHRGHDAVHVEADVVGLVGVVVGVGAVPESM